MCILESHFCVLLIYVEIVYLYSSHLNSIAVETDCMRYTLYNDYSCYYTFVIH